MVVWTVVVAWEEVGTLAAAALGAAGGVGVPKEEAQVVVVTAVGAQGEVATSAVGAPRADKKVEETQEVGGAGMEKAVVGLEAMRVAVEAMAEMMGVAKTAGALVEAVRVVGAARSIAHSHRSWKKCRFHPKTYC